MVYSKKNANDRSEGWLFPMKHLNKVRFLLLAGIIGAVAMTAFFLASTSRTERKASASTPAPKADDTEVSIRNFNMEESEAGAISWKIKADLAEKMKDDSRVKLHNLELVLFTKEGKRVIVTGDEGLMDSEKKEMTVTQKEGEPTRVLFDNGYLLTTTTLHWSDADKVAITDDPITLEGKGLRLTGVGMRARLDIQKVEVKSNVKAVIGKR
ncbi:MAG: LPS export ABC transporter periplasmic protein LptC [Nitrospirota bacterium]|nr:LPS export ABC transporter periplasmic protein LptC [Nitrospirota bacterium]